MITRESFVEYLARRCKTVLAAVGLKTDVVDFAGIYMDIDRRKDEAMRLDEFLAVGELQALEEIKALTKGDKYPALDERIKHSKDRIKNEFGKSPKRKGK